MEDLPHKTKINQMAGKIFVQENDQGGVIQVEIFALDLNFKVSIDSEPIDCLLGIITVLSI